MGGGDLFSMLEQKQRFPEAWVQARYLVITPGAEAALPTLPSYHPLEQKQRFPEAWVQVRYLVITPTLPRGVGAGALPSYHPYASPRPGSRCVT